MAVKIPEKAILALSKDLLTTATVTKKELLFLEISVKYPKLLRKKNEMELLFTLDGAKTLAKRYFQTANFTQEELNEL